MRTFDPQQPGLTRVERASRARRKRARAHMEAIPADAGSSPGSGTWSSSRYGFPPR